MRIVIDGYNLIRRIPELRTLDSQDLEVGRNRLAHELSAYRAGKGHQIIVVFDGADSIHLGGGSEKVAGITIRYSARGQSADQVIQKMCREGGAEVVITGDREIIDVAKAAGVTAVSPDLFWNKVQEEMYRRFKGEEDQEEGKRRRGEKGRKLNKDQRKDRGRVDKL
ncbi:MAG: NYN domain-containing protein [bacterium]|nr:NYN domain-containing protein [bacterium]MDT8366288.1 NYN domain-containing protein [bacterium]